jgi:hypothetical protein
VRAGGWLVLALLLAPTADRAAAGAPSEAEQARIERACERLLVAYTIATDSNDAAGIYGAYAEDGTLKNDRTSVSGSAAIKAYFEKRVAERVHSGITTRHVLSNILITVVDRNRARGTAYETMYRYDLRQPREITSLAPALLATITTEFERTPHGWRFKKRETVAVSAGAAAHRAALR